MALGGIGPAYCCRLAGAFERIRADAASLLVLVVLGFTGIAGQSMEFAKILFFAFLVLFLLGIMFNLSTGKRSGIV